MRKLELLVSAANRTTGMLLPQSLDGQGSECGADSSPAVFGVTGYTVPSTSVWWKAASGYAKLSASGIGFVVKA